MLIQDLWIEIRIMRKMGQSIKKISRELMISRNTVRKALRSEFYQPYQRENCKPGLLSEFMPFLIERAPQLDFNATSLFRELKKLGYTRRLHPWSKRRYALSGRPTASSRWHNSSL